MPMKLYFCLQLVRLLLMASTPDDNFGASRSCDLCRGEKSVKVCFAVKASQQEENVHA
jgi:hypothetical protein